MKIKIIKIPYDKNIPCTVHEIADAQDLSIKEAGKVLDRIKELIGIEWAEIALTILKGEDPRRDYALIVDEVGKLKDDWMERINARASQFYAGTRYGDPIVGNVVLCAREWTESFGECDLAGLKEWEVDALFEDITEFELLLNAWEKD